MFRNMQAAFAAIAVASAASSPFAALAQGTNSAPKPLEITLSPYRIPTAIQRSGSAVTVINAQEIERSSPATLTDVLRTVPGLSVTQAGGPGQASSILIRGANAGQTLVLLDGVRINDPSGPSGEFDASMIAPAIIERIEVLRGPQSALYGSDAMGGVVHIITKKGRGAPTASIRTEAGSYGTVSTIGSFSGANGAWSYAFSGMAQRIEGFSTYGYRVGRMAPSLRRPLEKDATTRFGGLGRIGYDPGTGFRFDIGVVSTHTRAEYDAAFGNPPDTASVGTRRFYQVHAKAELDTFGDRFTHSLQIFANRSDRVFRSFSSFGNDWSQFVGDRYGAEYQGRLKLDAFGSLMLGARFEREKAYSDSQNLPPFPGPRVRGFTGEQDTASLFSLWQLPVGERLLLSFAGRYDKVSDSRSFLTWRTTASYSLNESGTRLRASLGTGGKAPSLFQRFSPQYGRANLRPEDSVGADAGIDQSLFNGRLTLSAGVFANRFKDLIDFQSGPGICRANQPFGCYVNVARASTSGVELSGKAILMEDYLTLSGTYTYLQAKDKRTNLTLARRAPHSGRVAMQITPWAGFLIEPSVQMFGERFSSNGERDLLKPYARFDIYSEYALNKTFKLHARVENITNARYEDIRNYGTPGRAFYGGLTATW
ncbi:MAG: TonB-dependent receptor plug domain-containing protein [Rhabdaerophilum sp.]